MSDSCPPKILDEMHQANSLQQNQTKHHLKKVLLSSAFIVVPMVAFTITVLVVLFSNVVDLDYCPPSQLCNHTVTAGMNSTDYYVDFPVGRLAFVASLSSTFSLALVAAIMTMYGYVVAKQVLSLPEDLGQQTGSPSSHEMSTLIRVLNGEIILFVSIQAADTYLHIVIDAVSTEQLKLTSNNGLNLSRRLAPWYFEDPRDGVMKRSITFSRAFLHNGMNEDAYQNGTGRVWKANQTSLLYASEEVDSYVLNYTDPAGISYAIVQPSNIDESLDWIGTGYGVSTQCTGVPQYSCRTESQSSGGNVMHCPADGVYPNVTILSKLDRGLRTWNFDWHKAWTEASPYDDLSRDIGWMIKRTRDSRYRWDQNLTLQDGNTIFSNPWHWFAKVTILGETFEMPQSFINSALVLRFNESLENENSPFILMKCKTSVYDTVHTVVKGRLVSLNTTLSNGSVAGIVSQLSIEAVGTLAVGSNSALASVNHNYTTPEAFVTTYEQSMSKSMSVPLITYTVPEQAIYAHRRVTSVITRLPKVALWLLVVANSIFTVLGLAIAVIAAKAASPRTHQAQIRLSTSGLAAQLFASPHARREAKNDAELFQQGKRSVVGIDTKKVRMRSTSLRGAEFVTVDAVVDVEDQSGEETLGLRSTHTI
ncbi:hypothetical protein C7974DRAFT_439475 [Boeremia exigua]|uniref:uncharacterized protein n=1 Tax=Boeremia exigua TaxID=749465 RepID=UPI001E8DDFBE|nr:uncharacterized protein C7974DRAFT_439475 [Boeremia exigua]KAH6644208.1 hypothetical protein C7974DRAFT_439475 [Boeremia exigua]